MPGFKTGAISPRRYEAGETEVIDLPTLGCEGIISGAVLAGTLNLKASFDGETWFGSQDFTTIDTVAYTAIGPYRFLSVTMTGGVGYVGLQ